MKSPFQVPHYGPLMCIAMCGIGIIVFLNFSAQDFLTPGFVEKDIILENVEMKGNSLASGIIHVDEIGKKYVVVLSDNDSPAEFDVKIDDSQGDIIHNTIFEKGEIGFTPDVKGEYTIYVKNQSGKPVSVSLVYGLSHDYTQTSLLIGTLSVLLIIGGIYIIFHKYFTNMSIRF